MYLNVTGYVCHLGSPSAVPMNRERIDAMAASTTAGISIPRPAQSAPAVRVPAHRSRQITPWAGHALETLGHAIEYLTDEFAHSGVSFSSDHAQIQAVQILMACNREVYFDCPEIPIFGERWRALFHHRLV